MNVGCEKAMTSLLDLNDFALLHVFSYLNLRDSINFAGTSKRLKSVGGLHFIKYKRLNVVEYVQSSNYGTIPVETVLSYIGQHVVTLSIYSTMRSTVAKAVMDNCVNVTTLKIYNCKDSSNLKKWMQQLKLDRLTIKFCSDFDEMSVGLAALKDLKFSDYNDGLSSMQLTNILEKTTELETLKVQLYYPNFNYNIFAKLSKLQSVDIKIKSLDLVNLTKFLKMDVLTQFKMRLPFNYNAEDLQRLNSFLEILAERSKLSELQLDTTSVDQKTFRILKLFHLTSLGFYAFRYVDNLCGYRCICMIQQLVNDQPMLKNFDFLDKFLQIEDVDFVIKNLVKLETFTFRMRAEDLEQLDELRINELLRRSTSRPMLTLYINSDDRNAVKIELLFEQRKHRFFQCENGHTAEDSYFLNDDFTG